MRKIEANTRRRIEQATKQVEKVPRFVGPARSPINPRVPLATFVTTGAVAIAVVTGTGLSTWKRTRGHGPARVCIVNSSGDQVPDPNAQDIQIYLGSTGSALTSGIFCDCAFIAGVWVILFVHKCP